LALTVRRPTHDSERRRQSTRIARGYVLWVKRTDQEKARGEAAAGNTHKLQSRPAWRVLTDPRNLWRMIRESVSAWMDDYAPSMGAALSYYTVFSLAPLLLIVIAIAGLVFGREAAQGQIVEQLRGLMGERGATAIEGLLKSASNPSEGIIATIIGVVTLLLGATTVFGELQTDLDRIWRAPAAKKNEGLWNLVRDRLLSFGMIAAVGFLMLVSLVVSAVISAIGTLWAPAFGGMEIVLQVVNVIVALAITTVLFALVYKVLPRVDIGWHDVWVGALVTAILFSVGKFAIGLYIGKGSVVSGFGAAGSLAVILVWVYYSAQIFLLGAEFTWVYSYDYGSRQGMPRPAAGKEVPGKDDALHAEGNAERAGAQDTGAHKPIAHALRDGASHAARPAPRARSKSRPRTSPMKLIATVAAAFGAGFAADSLARWARR
jgi:membrane protein